MKLRIASDFHLEFLEYKSHIKPLSRDINDFVCLTRMKDEKDQTLLLAGDIVNANTCENMYLFFKSLSERFKEVYYIMGNHEHYKFNFNRTERVLKRFLAPFENICLVNNETIELEDIVLFASTLWTDCDRQNPTSVFHIGNNMTDFHIIGNGDKNEVDITKMRKFTPHDSIKEYMYAMHLLTEFDQLETDKKKVVMTHHSPSFQSTAPRFVGSPINGGFASNLDDFIAQSSIDLWVHGHMHNCCDYVIGDTRILANPRGYGQENLTSYHPTLVLDISNTD